MIRALLAQNAGEITFNDIASSEHEQWDEKVDEFECRLITAKLALREIASVLAIVPVPGPGE